MAISIDISSKDVNSIRNPLKVQKKPVEQKLPEIKDPKKEKRKGIIKKVLLFLGVLLLIGGGYYAFRFFQLADTIGIKITPADVLNPIKKDPELQRDSTDKYTAALLVGIDTRGSGSKLLNTDTIMVVTYNYETHNTVMISVPRDFHAQIPGQDGYYNKINSIYSKGEALQKGAGLEYLKKEVEKITDLEIQYYAMIDLTGFKEMVDAVGGITVNVDNSFTDYEYPSGDPLSPYETVIFEKGVQKMDGATALKYARSRHGNNGEGSDYQRARRQQKIINAIKEKVLSSETLLNPAKILDLISSVEKNIKLSEFTTEDIQAAIQLGQDQKEASGNSYSFVLDPAIGKGYGTIIAVGPYPTLDYHIAPVLGEGQYKDIHAIVSAIMLNPQFYNEDAVIRVYDTGAGYQAVYNQTLELQKKYPFSDILFLGTMFSEKEGTVVYSNTKGKNSETVRELTSFLKADKTKKPSYISNGLNGEDVTILIGKTPAPETSDNMEAK